MAVSQSARKRRDAQTRIPRVPFQTVPRAGLAPRLHRHGARQPIRRREVNFGGHHCNVVVKGTHAVVGAATILNRMHQTGVSVKDTLDEGPEVGQRQVLERRLLCISTENLRCGVSEEGRRA